MSKIIGKFVECENGFVRLDSITCIGAWHKKDGIEHSIVTSGGDEYFIGLTQQELVAAINEAESVPEAMSRFVPLSIHDKGERANLIQYIEELKADKLLLTEALSQQNRLVDKYYDQKLRLEKEIAELRHTAIVALQESRALRTTGNKNNDDEVEELNKGMHSLFRERELLINRLDEANEKLTESKSEIDRLEKEMEELQREIKSNRNFLSKIPRIFENLENIIKKSHGVTDAIAMKAIVFEMDTQVRKLQGVFEK